MGLSLCQKRCAIQKINELVEKIKMSCTSYTLTIGRISQRFQMQLSKKLKTLSPNFIAFLKST